MSLLKDLHHKYVFTRRVNVLANVLAECLPAQGDLLDVGCGDGRLDVLIRQRKPQLRIVGIDVLLRPTTHIPVTVFDGRVIPYADKSMDVVMFVDVLHHTDDPVVLLKEAARVSRGAVVIKDHLREGILANSTLRFMDWVGNAPHGVVLPYNYWSLAQWEQGFAEAGLQKRLWREQLGLYPPPFCWFFDRRLHFVARLEVIGQ